MGFNSCKLSFLLCLVSLSCPKQTQVSSNGKSATTTGSSSDYSDVVFHELALSRQLLQGQSAILFVLSFTQVLAASKNKISTLKGFPYLPSLEVSI